MKKTIEVRDPVVGRVLDKFIGRSNVGYKKYGVTLQDDDQPLHVWLTHAQEEAMDLVLYLQKAKEELTTEKEERILNNIIVHDETIL